ncbi:hypothetical protein ACIA6C_14415 [Streptomyces sp. NPDC051578]|uniref:hypothetical protein n=1 Tax=Streptomyces sp. NPDC051578 TaxID=3365662 RepID=UPI0037AF6BD4
MFGAFTEQLDLVVHVLGQEPPKGFAKQGIVTAGTGAQEELAWLCDVPEHADGQDDPAVETDRIC